MSLIMSAEDVCVINYACRGCVLLIISADDVCVINYICRVCVCY